jgi:hypothetical protein
LNRCYGIQQTGPRGFDKLFSTNWWMRMAQRKFGNVTLTIRTMLSFEPATISNRRYPELFQHGETAFGRSIVDGQQSSRFLHGTRRFVRLQAEGAHPVVFLRCSHGRPGHGSLLRILIGPPPRKIRWHRWGTIAQDSTHIAGDVVTVGITPQLASRSLGLS